MPKKTIEQTQPQTPLQRILYTVSMFNDNDVTANEVLSAAFQLTVASAEPKYENEGLHIDNGIERLGGIAVQRGEDFIENFIGVLDQGSKFAAEKTGRPVTKHVAEVIDVLHLKYAA